MRLAAMRAGALGPPPHRVPPRSPVFMQRNYHGLEDKSPGCSNFLALVPWTPPQIATASNWSSSDSEKREFFEVPMESDETEVDSMDVEESLEANAAAIDGESLHQWAVATTLHDPIVTTKPFSTCYVFKVTVRCHCCELTAAVYLQE
ncbi:Os02g0778100 [Oryza sativa Japonica Group]|uniref:Os02g0778100 protein n=1 Tax=Oryza sativa subsp. japonica TaxID=39947 RepID=A0A0N7KG69_ORYSJ|nr:Os02g0778100 [Oryza sativa Japonica Group]